MMKESRPGGGGGGGVILPSSALILILMVSPPPFAPPFPGGLCCCCRSLIYPRLPGVGQLRISSWPEAVPEGERETPLLGAAAAEEEDEEEREEGEEEEEEEEAAPRGAAVQRAAQAAALFVRGVDGSEQPASFRALRCVMAADGAPLLGSVSPPLGPLHLTPVLLLILSSSSSSSSISLKPKQHVCLLGCFLFHSPPAQVKTLQNLLVAPQDLPWVGGRPGLGCPGPDTG